MLIRKLPLFLFFTVQIGMAQNFVGKRLILNCFRNAYFCKNEKIQMPAKDLYHDIVKEALIKDGWTITDDPLILPAGFTNVFIDLGAERFIGAEKGNEKIAVEIKSFLSKSNLRDFQQAIGQFFVYYKVLQAEEPDRQLYIAVPDSYNKSFLKDPFFSNILIEIKASIIVFDEEKKMIITWKKN